MAKPKILIIYTGGTIGMGKDPMTGVLEPLDFNHLVSSMPEFKLIQAKSMCENSTRLSIPATWIQCAGQKS